MKKYSAQSSPKPLYILGLNEALGASAALAKDGQIIAAALEERFTSIKNQSGFPKNAIKFCCNWAGIRPGEVDLVVLSYEDPYPHFTTKRAVEVSSTTPGWLNAMRDIAPHIEYRLPFLNQFTDFGRTLYYKYYALKNQQIQIEEIARHLGISSSKIIRINHHLCHAYTAYFANPDVFQPTLVLTCDGAGDNLCATVSIVSNGTFKLIAQTLHTHSLGLFFASITSYLGLKAHEDEYKVMGLAPYASEANWKKIYTVFNNLLWVDGLSFKTRVPARQFDYYLKENLQSVRFDHVATATQKFLEDRLVEWIKNAVAYTRIKNVAFAGGVFLNVKANLEILKRTKIKHTYFLPSPGDDMNAIGACYYGFKQLQPNKKPLPLTNLYLGPKFTEKEIYKTLVLFTNCEITEPKNISRQVAQLLAKGEIVARFVDRMEFGARALGNRSILADPRKPEVIQRINRMIKMRDFWMPFAPTILAEEAHRYIRNPKRISAPYMVVAFDTTELGRKHLQAAIHPHDKTVRPQLLAHDMNPNYLQIIAEFKKLTGVGAILNTSFNIHGQPVVCSPDEALTTFKNSGLRFMQLGNFLVKKI